MVQQLELFEDMSLTSQLIAVGDSGPRYVRTLMDMLEADLFVIRMRKLDGILVGSKYAHLSLHEAALELLVGDAVKPAQVNAWVLALLMARVRPPQREAIGSSPKQRLKRRSGHQPREPPPWNR